MKKWRLLFLEIPDTQAFVLIKESAQQGARGKENEQRVEK